MEGMKGMKENGGWMVVSIPVDVVSGWPPKGACVPGARKIPEGPAGPSHMRERRAGPPGIQPEALIHFVFR